MDRPGVLGSPDCPKAAFIQYAQSLRNKLEGSKLLHGSWKRAAASTRGLQPLLRPSDCCRRDPQTPERPLVHGCLPCNQRAPLRRLRREPRQHGTRKDGGGGVSAGLCTL